MANSLIKMKISDDDDSIEVEEQKWCLADPAPYRGTPRVLCTGDVLDTDTVSEWEEKMVIRGGITCEQCIAIIKAYKTVKL